MSIPQNSRDLLVAVVIPTLNRPDFVIRQLSYYANEKSLHPVYIGDSSDEINALKLQKTVRKLQGTLPIVYRHYPKQQYSYIQCMVQLLHLIEEPYATFIGDDDFQVPQALTQCAAFLRANPDFTTAHGRAVTFQLHQPGPYGAMKNVAEYRQSEICENTAQVRLVRYLSDFFEILFSVHRTDQMRKAWTMSETLRDFIFTSELLPQCLAVVEGKCKMLRCISLVRQVHDAQNAHTDTFDWITNSDWQPSYEIFKKHVTHALMRYDHISPQAADRVIKKALWTYLNKRLLKHWNQLFCVRRSISDRLRRVAKRIPGATVLRRYIQSIRINELSLPALMNPRSPHHDDFLSIYRVVTRSI